MDKFLIIAATALFLFGVMLLFCPGTLKKLSDFLNKNILPIEDKMRGSNVVSGIILLMLGAVVFYLALKK